MRKIEAGKMLRRAAALHFTSSADKVCLPFQLKYSNRLSGVATPENPVNNVDLSRSESQSNIESKKRQDNAAIVREIFSGNFKLINTEDQLSKKHTRTGKVRKKWQGSVCESAASAQIQKHSNNKRNQRFPRVEANSFLSASESSKNGEKSVVEDDFAELDAPQTKEEDLSGCKSGTSSVLRRKKFDFQLLRDLTGSDEVKPRTAPPRKISEILSQAVDSQSILYSLLSGFKGKTGSVSSSLHKDSGSQNGQSNPQEDFRLFVCVEKLPVDVNIDLLKASLLRYGEITGSFRKSGDGGLFEYYVEFKNEDAKESALADQWLYIDANKFPIRRIDSPMTTVVRIMNVNPVTVDDKLLFTCRRCGNVDYLRRRENGDIYVYFNLRELPNMTKILNWLNNFTVDHKRWRASPAPLLHPNAKDTVLNTQEGQNWYVWQKKSLLQNIEKGFDRLNIGFQDLEELILSIKESRVVATPLKRESYSN